MDDRLPVTLNFDITGLVYAWINLNQLAKDLPNLETYVLAPSYKKNDEGSITILEYSFIHRDHVGTTAKLDKKYGKGNY
jgi:hypothetical protein